jgi:hypothetical protein
MNRMTLKEWAAVAYMVLAASLLAHGNTAVSGDQNLLLKLNADGMVIGSRPAVTWEECLLFRSTLQDVPVRGTGIRHTKSTSFYSVDIENQGNVYSLPEPGTGIMLSIGLFAIIHLGGGAWNLSLSYREHCMDAAGSAYVRPAMQVVEVSPMVRSSERR